MATTIRNQNLFCLNCGAEYRMNYPLPIDEVTNTMKVFDSVHKNCKKTWVEPVANEKHPVTERAMWWISNGETGMSSKTMWNHFMGNKNFPVNHPWDPDDFSRCYKLLEAIPEWKSRMPELKALSGPWSNLVDNWQTLTEMYEQNKKENWKNVDKIGMHVLMNKLVG